MHPSDGAPSAASPCYRIVVKDQLGPTLALAFAGMSVTPADHETTIAGPIADQAQLHAILRRIGSLNLVLLRVERSDI